ncbi:MAG: acyl-CoA dehydrogenase family protein [Myxococcota bacterium]|jgi:3-oxocholest-4-en-26-oyl-CoA dehydrogenase alpha subunit|nr:acyl-CoA dehydrogenase family protein [Myxococcota bacterium]
MELDFTTEQKKFRDELRIYFNEMMSDELVAELRSDGEGGGPLFRAAMKQMGRDGLLGVGWPEEYGGQGRTPMEQFIFADEVQTAGFPLPFLTLNTVGPTIMHYGTEEQKSEILPKVLAGEIFFAIGYSEPGAGTDLGSLQTSARLEGDEWVINGQKMWTSLAGYSDFIWLAARTDPEAPKHRGLSMFLVPTTSDGYSRQKIMTVGGVTTNATFYDDVRVPADALIGGENNGWSLITGQLNHERISLTSVGPIRRTLRDVVDWARETKVDGERVIDKAWVRQNLARVYAKVQVVRLMNWKQAWAAQKGNPHPAAASAVKVFGSELNIEAYRAMMEITSSRANIGGDDPGSVIQGRIESAYRNGLILTFGGGTNEVQRDIIAMAGMGLPHYKR